MEYKKKIYSKTCVFAAAETDRQADREETETKTDRKTQTATEKS